MGFESMQQAPVVGATGRRIGTIGSIYLHPETGEPLYVSVRTGLLGNRETMLPLDLASFADGQLDVPYAADLIKQAPARPSGPVVDVIDEQHICAHYGVEYAEAAPAPTATEPLPTAHYPTQQA